MTSPSENTSDWNFGRPSACSGAMYPTVPEPDAFTVRCATFENPKSVSFIWLSGNKMKLSGLMSQ